MRRVLLVTDGSPTAIHAVRMASAMVTPVGGEVLVIYIIPPVASLAKNTVSQGNAELNDIVSALRRAMHEGHAALDQAVNILRLNRIPYTARLEQGVPATLICQIADYENCDAVVIGSRGIHNTTRLALGGASKWPVGCVSRTVILVS